MDLWECEFNFKATLIWVSGGILLITINLISTSTWKSNIIITKEYKIKQIIQQNQVKIVSAPSKFVKVKIIY